MLKYIFVFSFIVSCVFMKFNWVDFGIVDGGLWASQALYMQTGDSHLFNFDGAYGHPGGPIIEGSIVIHELFGYPYYNSMIAFLIVFNGLIIASCCTLCYHLRRDHLWWIVVLFTLSLDRLYDSLSPPSAIASLLLVLLSLIALYVCEKKAKNNMFALMSWSLVGGLLVATRTDIGVISLVSFAILLKQTINWKKIGTMLAGSFIVFCIFDPFMWFMPIQHILDLMHKVTYHYADYVPTHMTLHEMIFISCLAFVAIALFIVFRLLRKKIEQPVPPQFAYTILLLTVVVYVILLTAHFQATRYFVPLILIWEVFLPLFVFGLIKYMKFSFLKTEENNIKMQNVFKVLLALILIAYPVLLLIYSVDISHSHTLFS